MVFPEVHVALMQLGGDDILEALLPEATDNEPGASPTPAEEAALLGNDATPQEAWETTIHPPDPWRRPPSPKVQPD